MTRSQLATFDEILEAFESLPERQQEALIQIVRRRQVERRRDTVAARIRGARKELAQGEVRRGSVDELLAEL